MQSFAPSPIRILLVDDREVVLRGLEQLIAGESPRMEVVSTATSCDGAKQLIKEKKPDILLLKIFLDGQDSTKLIPSLVKGSHTRVMIFVNEYDLDACENAVQNGACGIIYETMPVQTILKAIEKIYAGEMWIDRRTTSRILFEHYSQKKEKTPANLDAEKIAILTHKERMVVSAFAHMPGGTKNKQIATKLCMSDHTLRNHLTSIFIKLNITNRYDLFTFAQRNQNHPELTDLLPASSREIQPTNIKETH